jgi:hypothetical protein
MFKTPIRNNIQRIKAKQPTCRLVLFTSIDKLYSGGRKPIIVAFFVTVSAKSQ